ncbi:hypothetical protein Peur_036098 [Populus x canadensis]
MLMHGKLSFHGFVKLLHGTSSRTVAQRHSEELLYLFSVGCAYYSLLPGQEKGVIQRCTSTAHINSISGALLSITSRAPFPAYYKP